jgi:hypothetical protein
MIDGSYRQNMLLIAVVHNSLKVYSHKKIVGSTSFGFYID